MTATTLQEIEGAPGAWPAFIAIDPPYFSELDRPIDPASVWRRIEAWITRRWAARSVVYVANGPGCWRARLHPFTVSTTERWQNATWTACTLDPTPLGGLELPGEGPYRIAGTAGDDTPIPPDVKEAAQRLYVYARGIGMAAWAETALGGDDRPVAWAAKAIKLSGAGDLLRPYRRLGAE